MQKSKLYSKIQVIREHLDSHRKASKDVLVRTNPKFQKSAENLIHYLSLRTLDLRKIQDELSEIGLSSLSSPEAYTYRNILDLQKWLRPYAPKEKENGKPDKEKEAIGFKESRKIINRNTNRLFGRLPEKKKVHIMVTMPTIAAQDYLFVKNLIAEGMDIARINMSHDDPDTWNKIVANVQVAKEVLGKRCKIYVDLAGPKIRTEYLYDADGKPIPGVKGKRIFIGDRILLGKKLKSLDFGNIEYAVQATISIPSIIDDLKNDQPIWFDDGKIGGVIERRLGDSAIIRITRCQLKGNLFKGEKGINLPATQLNLPSLMPDDVDNLDFIAKNADIVGYSFVRTKEDVSYLLKELDKRGRSKHAGLVLKVENQEAFYNLPNMILEAMRFRAVGVMLARGDLAVELGFERISEVQQQILSICEAAHIPIIWATQVLENLAKKGLATRAEISDVAMAARAECVMLNKGPYILEAVRSLSDILNRMTCQLNKSKYRYRPLNLARAFFDNSAVKVEVD